MNDPLPLRPDRVEPAAEIGARRELRRRLLAQRSAAEPVPTAALHARLAQQLAAVLAELEPESLGLYAAIRGEFNALPGCLADSHLAATPLALPFCFRSPRRMEYRAWNRAAPALRDECDIPSADGALLVPDVLLVPCVGYTRSGYRLGYGGGYFDRYLAAHPHVTAVGVALGSAELTEAELLPQQHDRALALIVTEHGPV